MRSPFKYGVRSSKFIWAPVYNCTHWLRPRNSPSPRIRAHIQERYWSAKRRHAFETPWVFPFDCFVSLAIFSPICLWISYYLHVTLFVYLYVFSEIQTKPRRSKDDNLFSSLLRNTWRAFLPGSSRSPRGRTRGARRRCTCRTGVHTPHHTIIPSTLTISRLFILLFRTKLITFLVEYFLIGKNVEVKPWKLRKV
jgi:hypothetical protein